MNKSKEKEDYEKFVIRNCINNGNIQMFEDGYYYFTSDSLDLFSSEQLAIIAKEMERMNKPYSDSINQYFKEEDRKIISDTIPSQEGKEKTRKLIGTRTTMDTLARHRFLAKCRVISDRIKKIRKHYEQRNK